MVSQATLDELAAFAERGQIGRDIELSCSDLHPEAGSRVRLNWDFSASLSARGVLDVRGVSRQTVDPIGHSSLPVAGETLRVFLTVGAETVELTIVPTVYEPQLHVAMPSKITLGESFELSWDSNAQRCVAVVHDGPSRRELDLPPSGSTIIEPANTGELTIEILAHGPHAAFSDQGITTRNLACTVKPLLLESGQ